MYAEHAMVVDAAATVGVLRDALGGLEGAHAVVLQSGGRHHVFVVSSLQQMLVGLDDDDDLDDALGLEAFPTARVVRPGEEGRARPGDLLVDGADVAVVMAEPSGTRGHRGEAAAAPPPMAAPPPVASPSPTPSPPRVEYETAVDHPAADDTASDTAAADSDDAGGATSLPERTARFRAFPALDGPTAVTTGARFTVTVGFATQPAGDPDSEPVIVADAPERLPFTVHLGGFGLDFPEGVAAELVVDRDAPETAKTEFVVEAGPVRRGATRTVEASFEYEGELVGMAWLDVRVTAADEVPQAPPDAERRGGSGVSLPDGAATPDLTVEIRSQGAELEWVFHTRHGVSRPAQRVTSRLPAASGEAFAGQLMARLSVVKGSAALLDDVRGMGRFIAGELPVEFWRVVDATWAALGAGSTPTLLLTTNEPFVPWELAWVDQEVVDPQLLPAGVTAAPLGSLWQIGRWVPPRPVPRRPEGRPPSPPERSIDLRTLGVVVGDYSGDRTRNLPFAIEECDELVAAAQARSLVTVSVKAADAEVNQLLNPGPGSDGAPPCEVVHFAAHGQVSLTNPEHTGILLAGGRRLDLFAVRGSTIGEVSRPLVFLNACQVGTGGQVLSTYGGLVGAFLASGCRAFIAPLWNVDDDVAKHVALEFYTLMLDEGLTAGEALRRIRAGFGSGEAGSATPLAYLYYGHPDLRLVAGDDSEDD